jgi:hypothetical protein
LIKIKEDKLTTEKREARRLQAVTVPVESSRNSALIMQDARSPQQAHSALGMHALA